MWNKPCPTFPSQKEKWGGGGESSPERYGFKILFYGPTTPEAVVSQYC